MKRVLLIVNGPLDNAGVPRIMMDIFEGLKDEYSFEFLSYSSNPTYYDSKVIKNGGTIHYIGPKKQLNFKWQMAHMFFVRPWRVLNVMRKGHFDVVHSNSGFIAGDDMLMAKICGIRTRISHAHGTYRLSKKFIYRFHPARGQKLLKKYSTHRIAVSTIAGDTLFGGLPYELILNSVDFTQYDKIAKEQHEGINLLQVGYFCPNKNQLFSMEICNRLYQKGEKVHLYLIGYDIGEGYIPKMQGYIKENNLEEVITILPHDYDKFKLYPIIDYMLMPSHSEGLPVVALECQAAGINCVTSTAVSTDVDMGLLHRIPLKQIQDWVDYIDEKKGANQLDEQKKTLFSRDTFLKRISDIYNS